MKKIIKPVSWILLTAMVLLMLAACGGSSEPTEDKQIFPIGNGSVSYYDCRQKDNVVAVLFKVEDKHFSEEDFKAFGKEIVIDSCTMIGWDNTFDDEGWSGDEDVASLAFIADNGVTVTPESVHLPKPVEVGE